LVVVFEAVGRDGKPDRAVALCNNDVWVVETMVAGPFFQSGCGVGVFKAGEAAAVMVALNEPAWRSSVWPLAKLRAPGLCSCRAERPSAVYDC
jgi:hypothetical protein